MEKFKPKLGLGSSSGSSNLLTAEPGLNKVMLGDSVAQLSCLLEDDQTDSQIYKHASGTLKQFHQANAKYVDQVNLQKTTCSTAIRGWARDRLHGLKIPYEIQSRLKQSEEALDADRQASLQMVQLAEDFTLITKFCRDLKEARVNMGPHTAGAEYLFEFIGECADNSMRVIENKGYEIVLNKFSKNNSLKLRAHISRDSVDLQVIVLKQQSRLGFSPVD